MKKLFKNLAMVYQRGLTEDGFTLIELLIVISIIGVLTAIAVPAYLGQRKVAVDSTLQNDLTGAGTTISSWGESNPGDPLPIPASVDSPLAKSISLSSGNSVIIRGNSEDYCIIGTNPRGKQSVSGIVYSSINGGLNKDSTCTDTFVPAHSPSINGTLNIDSPDNAIPAPSATATTASTDNNVTTCAYISLTSTPGTNITCEKTSDSTPVQDNFNITVSTTSTTPLKWSVAASTPRPGGFKQAVVDSISAVPNTTFTTPVFTITGTDKSWNGAVADPVNYAYTSNAKTITFRIRVQ